MKRRKFLIALGVVPPLVLGACKGEVVIPPTIVTGKVTDESGLPVDGVEVSFSTSVVGVPTEHRAKATFQTKFNPKYLAQRPK